MAWQDALGVSAFSSSQEAFVAEALFEAYRSQDAEAVKRVVKAKHVLSDLDNAVRPNWPIYSTPPETPTPATSPPFLSPASAM